MPAIIQQISCSSFTLVWKLWLCRFFKVEPPPPFDLTDILSSSYSWSTCIIGNSFVFLFASCLHFWVSQKLLKLENGLQFLGP
jgi:hypothetical protein